MLPHGCIFTTPPTPSPCAFLGYDPTANGPCAVPLSVRKAAVCIILPCRRNVTKLFWSRSGIMHVAIAWDHKPLLLLATALLPNRTTESFEREAGPPYDKQRIQMGLRSGNTVLICFRSGVGHYQSSVLIALAADLHTNKPWQGQHKFWKYVSPIRTYFAWLPEQLARTYCSAALDRRSTVRCTTCREVSLISGILWCSKTFIILEIPKVPRNFRSSFACPVKG